MWKWIETQFVEKEIFGTIVDFESGEWVKEPKKHLLLDTVYVAFSRSLNCCLALYDKYGGGKSGVTRLYFTHGKRCSAKVRLDFNRQEVGEDNLVFVSVYGALEGGELVMCSCTEEAV